MISNTTDDSEFHWKCQPEADALQRRLVRDICEVSEFASKLQAQMLAQTGTRLIDWVDHLSIKNDTKVDGQPIQELLTGTGFRQIHTDEDGEWYTHSGGLFAPVCVDQNPKHRLVVRVERGDDFLAANQMQNRPIQGDRATQFRRSHVAAEDACDVWVCERHGFQGWQGVADNCSVERRLKSGQHYESFKLRQRECRSDERAFQILKELTTHAIEDLGRDWACDLFFAAERDYWQRRNRAARIQKDRQDQLGLGWANHDHHTYRSSRQGFASLIEVLELMGFYCRERFYAGEQAGWGAQVLEHPVCGIVVFADVDLSPAELAGDFAHNGLTDRDTLGTVGLWCQLHGEAILQAGMHHLECTFEFDEARRQLADAGVSTMTPFTDFNFLRQAFTTGEVWTVAPERVEQAVRTGALSRDEAERFLRVGSVGSHLEILERNEGFKGFNQTGVSDIILKTDPRRLKTGSDPTN